MREPPGRLGGNSFVKKALSFLVVCSAVIVVADRFDQKVEAQPYWGDPTGSWFGIAKPVNPETSPFPEIVMEPTFFRDGNLIANDSIELTSPHGTAHGAWTRTGRNSVRATFVWLNLVTNKPNGFAGNFRVVLEGQVSPVDPDRMTGTLHAYLYPEGVNVLGSKECIPPNPAALPPPDACLDLGVFRIESLSKIKP